MNKFIYYILGWGLCLNASAQPEAIDHKPLGVTYSPSRTTFRLWAPEADAVEVNLYSDVKQSKPDRTLQLQKVESGNWETTVKENLQGKYYTFQTTYQGKRLAETPGIYAKAVGVNGHRGFILDLTKTNPAGWSKETKPKFINRSDAIIYEVQIRDFTKHPSSGVQQRGKFRGFWEGGKTQAGTCTGIDHLVELGITHVHLLPAFDFRSIDESLADPPYNWGYDPLNYLVPEGSFASDPHNPAIRIREFKELVLALHQRGIRVILDVVFNHTGETQNSAFNLEYPGYYYRYRTDGTLSDAAACGNETASEKAAMRRFMIEACKYWMTEYHIDGFRFDLMGIHDISTMNMISSELLKVDPQVLLYGEGWTAGSSPLPDSVRAIKANTFKINKIAAFSDDLRDGLKGSVFEINDRGFASGKPGMEMSIAFGLVGAIQHADIDYPKVNYSKTWWAAEPWQCISYSSCHDNHTLTDKLQLSNPKATADQLQRMNKLAQGIVLLSQGIPFLHAGEEFGRSKQGVENSYNQPDSINSIRWNLKRQNYTLFNYYKRMISIRKNHPAFRLGSAEAVRKLVRLEFPKPGIVVYQINGQEVKDPWGKLVVVMNGSDEPTTLDLPGRWELVENGDTSLTNGSRYSESISIPATSLLILRAL